MNKQKTKKAFAFCILILYNIGLFISVYASLVLARNIAIITHNFWILLLSITAFIIASVLAFLILSLDYLVYREGLQIFYKKEKKIIG